MIKSFVYTIIEHQTFKESDCGSKKFFDALVRFSQNKNNECFIKHYKKSGIDYLKAKNYVGVIQTKYGTLEILPKCFDDEVLQREAKGDLGVSFIASKQRLKELYRLENFENLSKEKLFDNKELDKIGARAASRSFLIECLKLFFLLPKVAKSSFLQTSKFPLLDIFIQMFCQEFFEIYKRGIRHDYVNIQKNHPYLKGKLLFKEHLKYNLVSKERFFTSNQEYLADIPQNRLIKTTLEFLKSKAVAHITLKQVNQALEFFRDIPRSKDFALDFKSCNASRHFSYYENILQWCKLFLEGNGFDIYSGDSRAYALLFPMEKLFEKYVACMLKKHNNFPIQTQKSDKWLLAKDDKKRFKMSLDLHIERNQEIIIADTKWKQLTLDSNKHFGISQGDLYQLFSYAIYHEAKEVWLIYPRLYTQSMEELFESIQKEMHESKYIFGEKEILLKILFAPLF